MKPNSPRRAKVISEADLPEAIRQWSKRYECDCACPATLQGAMAESVSALDLASTALMQAPDAISLRLDADHTAWFNPVMMGGVVVANQPACELLRRFEQPAPLKTASQAEKPYLEHAVEKFLQAGILEQAGEELCTRFREEDALSAWLQVTDSCNLRCSYCYIQKSQARMSQSTGAAALEALFSSAKRYAFKALRIKYAGGEPSLNSGLVLWLHDYAERLSSAYGVTFQDVLLSNGVSLSPRFMQELKARQVAVMISLDGVGAPHDAQRPLANGSGSFIKVQQTIERLMSLGVNPHLSLTLTRRNLAHLDETVQFALERGLTFSLNFYRQCDLGQAGLEFDHQAMIHALRRALKVIEDNLPPWSLLGVVLDRGQLLEPRLRACGMGQSYVVINASGQVSQCHMTMTHALGDVLSADPCELIRQAGEDVNPPVTQREGCRECPWRFGCSGGCALMAQKTGGDKVGRSPYCAIYQFLYPEALRLEGLRLLKYTGEAIH